MAKTKTLELIPNAYLPSYLEQMPALDWDRFVHELPAIGFTSDAFSFYVSVSSVYSSKIEGEAIELDSFLNHKFFNGQYLSDYTRKVDDLFAAYTFARDQSLNRNHLLKAHAILTKHILRSSGRGKIRSKQEFIINSQGQIEYVAADAGKVGMLMEQFFADLALLLKQEHSLAEVLYFAAIKL